MDDESDPFGSLGLLPMNLSDKALFDEAFSAAHPQLSDYTFANTFIWRDAIHLRWQRYHDCLCVFANGEDGLSLLFPPLGKGDFAAALAEALSVCRAFNRLTGVEQTPRVEYVSQSLLAKFPDESLVKPMSGDYVYLTRRMIDLDGPDLGAKRKGRSWFLRHHHPVTAPLTEADVPECLEFLNRWREQAERAAQTSDASAVPDETLRSSIGAKRKREVAATAEALRHFAALDLRGMLLRSEGKLVGFTLGERLPDGRTCSILIEKTDREYRGSANYIFSEFCRQYWSETTWCNAGDDWEIPSLAWTKQSYQPVARLNKWVVWPKLPAKIAMSRRPTAAPCRLLALAPGEKTTLRRAGLEDLSDLLRLESNCFSSGESFTRRQIRYLLRSPRAATYVLRVEERLAAAAIVVRRRTPRGEHARLYSMAVAPAMRRRGYGRLLLQACLKSLAEEGVGTLSLEVRQDNLAAVALYESMGFAILHPLENYYGPGVHGWRMAQKLSAAMSAAPDAPPERQHRPV